MLHAMMMLSVCLLVEQEDTLSKFNVILNQCKQLLTCEGDRAPIGTGKREW